MNQEKLYLVQLPPASESLLAAWWGNMFVPRQSKVKGQIPWSSVSHHFLNLVQMSPQWPLLKLAPPWPKQWQQCFLKMTAVIPFTVVDSNHNVISFQGDALRTAYPSDQHASCPMSLVHGRPQGELTNFEHTKQKGKRVCSNTPLIRVALQ